MSGMKKFFGIGLLALLTTAYFTSSCSRDEFSGSMIDAKKATFNDNFIAEYGNIAPNHDWGFGTSNGTRAFTRSFSNPAVLSMNQPYTEAWVTDYLTTAKEPDATNTNDNYDNTSYAVNWDVCNALTGDEMELKNWLFNNSGYSWEQQVAWMLENRPNWLSYNVDETFVTKFKITGSYNGIISVAASEGYVSSYGQNGEVVYGDRQEPFLARTVVVTGTWTIPENQRMGSGSLIVIANGGKVIVSSGKQLQTVNHARIVVLPGGELTGDGSVEVSNGNGTDDQNYNGGTISVATFNNNFGKFHNYGLFLVNEYQGGAKESNFYNHALVAVDHFGGSTANARIFNNCQFYVARDARIRNYEGTANSSLIVDGQLMFSSSEDGTSDPTYVGLAVRALVQAGSLYNNGTSWSGPTSGYAVLSIGQFDYINWVQEHPEQGGYFANNIYVQADTWSNSPGGNGMGGETAEAKFANVKNAAGNGGVKVVDKGNNLVIPADPDYVKGNVKSGTTVGCTPGFSISEVPDDTPPSTEIVLKQSGRVFCEDLGNVGSSDIDYNDVVFDAWIYVKRTNNDPNTDVFHCAFIQLLAAGGTMSIQVAGEDVHPLFGVKNDVMVNTFREDQSKIGGAKHAEYGVDSDVSFPAKIVITDAYMVTDYYGEMNIKNIPITVKTYNTAQELTDEDSKAPLKFMAPIGTKWAAERVRFGDAYERFSAWVSNPVDEPWEYPNDFYTYEGTMPAVSDYAPTEAEIAAAATSTSNGGNGGKNIVVNNDGTTPPDVAGPIGHTATWSGTKELTVNSEGNSQDRLELLTSDFPSAFNNMGNGTYVRIYGYGTTNDWFVMLAHQQTVSPWHWTNLESWQQSGTSVNTSTPITFGPLSGEEAQAIINDGKFIVHGRNFVVKYVDIDNSGVQQEQPGGDNTGGLTYTSSNNGNDYVMTVAKSAFASVKTGDIIRLYGVRNDQNNFYVSVYGNNSNHNANLAISDWSNGNTTQDASKLNNYIDIPVSCELTVSTLKEYGLYISANITPSKLELISGTRTTQTGLITFFNGSENAGYSWAKTLNTTVSGESIDYKNVAAGSVLRIYGSQQANDTTPWSVTVNNPWGSSLPFVGFQNANGITSFNKGTDCIELVFNDQTVITASAGGVQVLAYHFTITKIELDCR